MDYSHMDASIVRGLDCARCEIASCTTSVMRTPVSKFDACTKFADPYILTGKLEWDSKQEMYFITRNADKSCVFFDHTTSRCSLPLEQRFNSCLVYPVRVYQNEDKVKLILNHKCPSALSIFDMVARREPSTMKYIKTAAEIYKMDDAYRLHVLNKTKDFKQILLLGNLDEWAEG